MKKASDRELGQPDSYLIIANWLATMSESGLFTPPHVETTLKKWCGAPVQCFLDVVSSGFLKRNAVEELSSLNEDFDLDEILVEDYSENRIQISIDFGICKTRFGDCLLGVDQIGRICWVSFFDQGREEAAVSELKAFWNLSAIKHNQLRVEPLFYSAFRDEALSEIHSVRLLAMGSQFQLRVWKKLLSISQGSVISYHGLAKSLKLPGGSQAVGSALAKNHLALVVPCHRVVRKDGSIHEFRWGTVRKKMMIGYELLQRTTSRM